MTHLIWVDGRVVGEIKGDEFIKNVRGSKHFLRVPPAICLDVASIEEAEFRGAKWVHIHDNETGKDYYDTVERIKQDHVIGRGFGDQYIHTMNLWKASRS